MSLFDEAREKLAGTARAAVNASREMIEVSKLNTAIKSEEYRIKEIMYDIGREIYETYKDEKPVSDKLRSKCDDIMECEKKIEELKLKILEIKNLKSCVECGTRIPLDYIYCPKCGAKVE